MTSLITRWSAAEKRLLMLFAAAALVMSEREGGRSIAEYVAAR